MAFTEDKMFIKVLRQEHGYGELLVPGAFSWFNASLSTNSTFSTVRVVRFLPLPGFLSTVPVSSIFFNNVITDDRHQPLFKNSFRNLFAPLFLLSQRRRM